VVAHQDARFAHIQDVFEREQIDDQWAAETEATIDELATAVSGTRVLSAECRSTLCRIEAEHDTDEGRARFMDDVIVKVQQAPRATIRRLEGRDGGVQKILVFLVRSGHSMPSLR
jgi:hypothetical protein